MQCSLPSLAPRDAPDRQRELDVAKRGKPGKQITVLSDVSDAGVQAVHRSAIAEHGATGGANQPRGQSQQRRFSTTRGAHNGCDPPWRNVEADAVQRQHLVLLADKSKPDIRKPYRRPLFSSVDHKCPSIIAPPSLQPAKTDGHTAQRYTRQLKNLFVHNSPSRVAKAVEIILVSSATLMLFSHMVVVIRQLRG